MVKTLNLIGGGRVGATLGRLWQQSGQYQIQDVLTQSIETARKTAAFIGAGRAVSHCSALRPADLWMLAVPDGAIAPVAQALAGSVAGQPPSMAFHCSGAQSSRQLEALGLAGWQIASAHCLLSFASPPSACEQFPGTPCALEGNAALLAELKVAFTRIGGQCFALEASQKLLYHAGAVFATNFLPVLQSIADQLWHVGGMPDEVASTVRAALLRNSVHNILSLGPSGALTGPAARGDTDLVQRQASALTEWNPAVGDAYKALSLLAAELAQQGIKMHPQPHP